MIKKFFLFLLVVFFTSGLFAKDINLNELFKKDPEIRVFLGEVMDETGNPLVKVDTLREIFKKSLEKRINMKFVLTENKESADIIVNARILKYVFTKKAFPLCLHTTTILADIKDPKSSAKLTVDYEVLGAKDGKFLLKYDGHMTEARKPIRYMEGDNGFIYGVERNVDKFIHKAFYPKR